MSILDFIGRAIFTAELMCVIYFGFWQIVGFFKGECHDESSRYAGNVGGPLRNWYVSWRFSISFGLMSLCCGVSEYSSIPESFGYYVFGNVLYEVVRDKVLIRSMKYPLIGTLVLSFVQISYGSLFASNAPWYIAYAILVLDKIAFVDADFFTCMYKKTIARAVIYGIVSVSME